MAFIPSVDTFSETIIGDRNYASAIIGSERDLYIMPYGTISQYDPVGTGSTWVFVDGLESFEASDTTNLVDVYDNKDLTEQKEGKTSSELKITQVQRGLLNSIYPYKGDDLWFAECITDDRAPTAADGSAIYYEMRLYRGKINNISETKGDAESLYKLEGTGSYTVTSKKILQKGVTPVSPTISGATGLVSGSTANLTITANDIYGDAITLTDITALSLMNEITSITVESTSGVTFTQSAGTDSNIVKITASSTTPGSIVLRGKVVTSNGGTFYSANKTITYTTV